MPMDPREFGVTDEFDLRWLTEKDPSTLHDLADEFGVSAERIRQIENKALSKMKESMADLGAAS